VRQIRSKKKYEMQREKKVGKAIVTGNVNEFKAGKIGEHGHSKG
jgi:hypothetical protein